MCIIHGYNNGSNNPVYNEHKNVVCIIHRSTLYTAKHGTHSSGDVKLDMAFCGILGRGLAGRITMSRCDMLGNCTRN